jgi:hypothetical protein
MVGGYLCHDCKAKIDPIVYHLIRGNNHVLFEPSNMKEFHEYIDSIPKESLKLLEDYFKHKAEQSPLPF